MIRVILITAAFLSVTIALVVIQPGSERHRPSGPIDVTRSQTDLTRIEAAPAAQDRAQPEETLGAGLLDVLGPSSAAQPAEETATVVSSLRPQIRPQMANPATTLSSDNPLEQIVIRALMQGQSEAYIDAMVNDAAQSGAVEVPTALVTSDGRVDTSALLSALGSRSTASPAVGPGRGVYMVEPGDTLASIAYRFYGQTSARHAIFEANRDRLNSRNTLTAGTQLVLPAL